MAEETVYKPFYVGNPVSTIPERGFYDFMRMIHQHGEAIRAEDFAFADDEEDIYTCPEGKVGFLMSVTCSIIMRDGVFGGMYLSLAYPSSTLINRFFSCDIAGESGTSTLAENQNATYPIPIKVDHGKCLRFNATNTAGAPAPYFSCFVSCLIYEVPIDIYDQFINRK